MNTNSNKRIYLDYNATTPILKEVGDEMIPYIYEHFGNPSSSHFHGQITKASIEKARKQVSEMLNCSEKEIIFTSGGTESNNHAIKGFVFKNKNKGNHIITSCVEHPAVLEVCKYLEKNDFKVTYLSVNKHGIINLEELKESITNETILITIMHANNEVRKFLLKLNIKIRLVLFNQFLKFQKLQKKKKLFFILMLLNQSEKLKLM